jgi:enoyl-CoA hydratase/carnithine racemase
MSAAGVDGIVVDASDGVLKLELDRPAQKNALDMRAIGRLVRAMEAEANALELSSRTADFKEGLAAFRDRRPPRFEGR